MLLHARQLSKNYEGQEVFSVESLYVYKGDRIGVVGDNGAGKSTLLSILAGELKEDSGTVERYGNAVYIPQLNEGDVQPDARLASLWRVPEDDREMSGGERTRKKIASAIGQEADVIIADEPTSHLDIQGIEGLERTLKMHRGAVLLTSHDKQLLNEVCTTIWEIENQTVTMYEGNYDAYQQQKQAARVRQNKDYETYAKEKKRLESAIENVQQKSVVKRRPSRMGNSEARLHKRSARATKAKLNRAAETMHSRIDQLEKKEKPMEHEVIVFDIAEFPKLHSRYAVQFNDCEVKVGNRSLKSQVSGAIKPGQKLAITGANGSGKTTLLNMVARRDSALTVAGPAKLGIFSQQQENLNENETILENVTAKSPYKETFIRNVLARLGFKREDVHKPIAVLSGGERVRASLATVFLHNNNLLLLDEPTNYLDLTTKEALTEVLRSFPGTIIFVSHDRSFVDEVADDELSFANNVPTVSPLSRDEQTAHSHTDEDLLAIEMQITETLSKLSVATTEEEKKELDAKFQDLLKRKQRAVK
ncbi:LOW QUALITY PROTEIN: hypothetical protein JCM19037_2873 [Geomicrobium sp. JCM 19037]|nr:LOW QUALITY PROTEIN: hypothetical protein JCM19037_2873 [Geomicrobium sp. JCM 19037]